MIKPGTKKERVINLLEIELDDGTRFEPVLSIEAFKRIQKIRSGKCLRSNYTRKRTNPLPKLVTCGSCQKPMYPSYRKVRKAGWIKEEQLGYECHTKTEQGKCPQWRIKAEVVFDYIAENMPTRVKPFTSKEYKAYVLAVHLLTQKMRDNSKALNGKITRSLKLTKEEKEKFVLQRAELLTQNKYDPHTKEVFEKRIWELSEVIENLKHQKQEIGKNVHQKIRSFTKFLELTENLHHYWLSSNYKQKEQISKNLLWNLVVSGREVRSASWLKPLWDAENMSFIHYGGRWCKELEPNLETLWHRYFSVVSRETEQSINTLASELSASIKPKYSLVEDIAQITGIKTKHKA